MNRTRAVLASYAGVIIYSGLVFLGAWRLWYWQGILYVLLALLGVSISHLLMPGGSDLPEVRARGVKTGQAWDKRLLGMLFVVNVATFVVAGMDSGQFGWSGSVPLWVTGLGAVLMVAGQVIFAFAKRENAFFSSTVEIQVERGHSVCTKGLYALIRHPGYLGMLLSQGAFPLVMGSYWAFVPATLVALLLVVRTLLEDRFLILELPGYRDYAGRTRFRLVPGLF